MSRVRGCAWLIDGFWIGWLDLLTAYTQLGTTGNYSAIAATTLYILPFHTHYDSHSSLVVSWQRIHKSHCNIKSHMKSFFHSLIPFLPLFCLCSQANVLAGWRLETQPTPLNWTLLYNHFARTTQKTQPPYCWEGVITVQLHSNGSYSIVACVFVAAGMCLPSRCLAMNVYSDFTIPAFGLHVTVS
jgi:hypothetical protein